MSLWLAGVSGPELLIVMVVGSPVWLGGLLALWFLGPRRRRSEFSSPAKPPAAWYADPTGRYELRYWDGNGWTQHVSVDGRTSTDPLA